MKKREFIAGLGSAAALPVTGRAQTPNRVPIVGYLGLNPTSQVHAAFKAGLRDLGYIEGSNIHIEARFPDGDMERLPGLARELVDQNVDVIVTYATGLYAVQHETNTIPIVIATGADLVAMGIVNSLAHPGGNITGLTFFLPELMAKRLALLKEAVPSIHRVGVLLLRDNPSNANVLEVMRGSANALHVELRIAEIGGPSDLDGVFGVFDEQKIDGAAMIDHAQVLAQAHLIGALAQKYRMPSVGPVELPESGGLMGYGVDFSDMFRRAAALVDKILKGEKPADIPVEQATAFKLVLNTRTARALKMEMPPILLARADEVIE
jgi:putative tryptophan/tyrosine transport system substrate-binding protein